MATTFECGPNKLNGDQFVGSTVRQFLNSYASLIEAPSNPTVEVRSNGSATWVAVNDNYRILSGDSVRFSRQTGTKG